MTSVRYEFWIDVGGTFTDCFARRPDGTLLRHKLLSSGVVKGTAAADSSRVALVDPARRVDPAGFWDGWAVRLLDGAGQTVADGMVRRFDRATGTLVLETPLACDPPPGCLYELHSPLDAPIVAIRYLLGLALAEPIPPASVRLGTTRGTNALITRSGAATGLATTRGFGDILDIGYQNRPRLFDLDIRKSERLAKAVVEIDERVTAEGQVLRSPDRGEVMRQLTALKAQGIESLAICLLHAFAHPAHERWLAEVARSVGFSEISVSSQVAPLVKLVPRADTTCVDAYLTPVLRSYVGRLRRELAGSELKILTSAGGLVEADALVGKDSILSGPAGGVVGFSRVAQAAGFERAIGFDMGGTSTDVSRFAGPAELEYETEKAGVRVVAPMMAIETVAAGGGSICRFDGVKLVVGPESAGADPGPACYGRGGPLTVTDVNLFLGKIPPQRFPFPLFAAAVEERLAGVAAEIGKQGKNYDLAELAEGFVRVANAHMAKAIRSISVAKGYDLREYVLVPFGGAAGQHACAIAEELEFAQILCHPDAGLLSAYGIGLADVSRHRVLGLYQPYSDAAVRELEPQLEQLAADAATEVLSEGISADRIEVRRSLELRYQGVEQTLTIAAPDGGNYADIFAAEHRRLYGYVHDGRALELVSARVEVRGRSPVSLAQSRLVARSPASGSQPSRVFVAGRWQAAEVFDRGQLRPGDVLAGPAIVAEVASTTVIDPGWTAEMLSQGELLICRTAATGAGPAATASARVATHAVDGQHPDPILLEIFNHQFAGIAEQMGITLRNTATSVNVKERLDFSCAIFTASGDLVVNAPHIPVHLGAMSETVKRILLDNPGLAPGDVFVTNHPYRGGSHLPDVTVVTPIFDDASGQLSFFTASRAHHAEIGGIVPGSMPPFSKNLAEEGVLIANFRLLAAGTPHWDRAADIAGVGSVPVAQCRHQPGRHRRPSGRQSPGPARLEPTGRAPQPADGGRVHAAHSSGGRGQSAPGARSARARPIPLRRSSGRRIGDCRDDFARRTACSVRFSRHCRRAAR